MKIRKYLAVLNILILSSGSFASDTENALDAMSGGWGSILEHDEPETAETVVDDKIEMSETIELPEVCREDQQISLPKSVFDKLLSSGNLNASQPNYSSGDARFFGGKIIANCFDMLDIKIDPPRKGRGYLFYAGIKRNPSDCKPDANGVEKCTYKAKVVSDKMANVAAKEDITIEVEPNLQGFFQCMKQTGVLENVAADENSDEELVLNKDKIVPTDFNIVKRNFAKKTASVEYLCSGPECGKGSDEESSTRKGGACKWFEPINDSYGNPVQFSSAKDAREKDLLQQLQVTCNEKDYRAVGAQKYKYSEFENYFKIAESWEKHLLKDEVKSIHKKISKSKTYEKLNAQDIRQTMKDFWKKIVSPLKQEILALQERIEESTNDDDIRRLQAELDVLISELYDYTRPDYITAADYKNMQSFAKKAQLDKKDWRDAALYSYLVQNSAWNLLRYHSNPKDIDRKYKQEVISVADSKKMMRRHFNEQKEKMGKLADLAADREGEVSFAAEAKAEAQEVAQNYNKELQELYQEQQQGQQLLRQCMSQYNSQACIQQVQARLQEIQYEIQEVQEESQYVKTVVESYNNEAETWSEIEAERNKSYGIKTRNLSSANTQTNNNAANILSQLNSSGMTFAQQMQILAQAQQSGQFNTNNLNTTGVGNMNTSLLNTGSTVVETSSVMSQYYQQMRQQQMIQQMMASRNPYSLTTAGSSVLQNNLLYNNGLNGNYRLNYGTGLQSYSPSIYAGTSLRFY